jgi:hypothetical protein
MGWTPNEVGFPAGQEINSLFNIVQTGSGANPASYTLGTEGSFPRDKAARPEADHSPPSTAEFENAGRYAFTPTYLHDALLN